jgi:hypothetical protein
MKEENKNGGTDICSVLFIVFLVLKLVGVISWSWWWVTSPLWIPLALVVVIFVLALIASIFE